MRRMRNGKELISLMLPRELFEKLDAMSKVLHMSRSAVIEEAISLLATEADARGGLIIPFRSTPEDAEMEGDN